MSKKDDFVPLCPSFQIERRARINRSRAINAFARGTVRMLGGLLNGLAVRSMLLLRRVAKRRLRSAIRELQRFDDRTLADIGLSRCEIESAVRDGLPAHATHRPRQQGA